MYQIFGTLFFKNLRKIYVKRPRAPLRHFAELLFSLSLQPNQHKAQDIMSGFLNFWKAAFVAVGGWIGWLVGEFAPTFPLIVVAVAFQLDKRVKATYPDKATRPAKFTSFAFGSR